MEELLESVRSQLRTVFSGRAVVLAGGVAAFAMSPIEELRRLGAERFLVLATGPGTGSQPQGDDTEVMTAFAHPEAAEDAIAGFRDEERMITSPTQDVEAALARFDPGREAIVLSPAFLDVRMLGDRPIFGARRSEWVALEDKTIADEMFDAVGVPRPPSAVVPVDADAIVHAAATLDRGAGTVWAADARGGFNGGGEYVRWVRDDADRRDALALLLPKCDRVRVAAFAEGVPCSIHGFVVADGVAVLRPVELVTLRAPIAPRLRYCGCATFFDPSAAQLATMRDAARRMGEHLRARVGFRGAFTLDGIAGADGWVATECNPRFGAGLGYVSAAVPDLYFTRLHYAVVAGVVDVASAELERIVVEASARTRWGGAWTGVECELDRTSAQNLVGDADGFRIAREDEPADAVLEIGPARTGGFVRISFAVDRTPSGPSIAPRAVAGFSYADAALELGLGPLTAAVSSS